MLEKQDVEKVYEKGRDDAIQGMLVIVAWSLIMFACGFIAGRFLL